MKNKKKSRKSSAAVAKKQPARGKQVARPANKKPRPKKEVEPKFPKLGMAPKAVDAPKEWMAVFEARMVEDEKAAIKMMEEFDLTGKWPWQNDVAVVDAPLISDEPITMKAKELTYELEKAAGSIDETGRINSLVDAALALDSEALAKELQLFDDNVNAKSEPIKTARDKILRPGLGELKDRYREIKQVSTSASTTPPVYLKGEAIEVEMPYGQTEESLARLINVAVNELKAINQKRLGEIVGMFGEEYKSKGPGKMTAEDKAKIEPGLKEYTDEQIKRSILGQPYSVNPISKKLGWFDRVVKWLYEE
jgi:hypothetical protein